MSLITPTPKNFRSPQPKNVSRRLVLNSGSSVNDGRNASSQTQDEVYVYICEECDEEFNERKMLHSHHKISHLDLVQLGSLMDSPKSLLVLANNKGTTGEKSALPKQQENCVLKMNSIALRLQTRNPVVFSDSFRSLIGESKESDKKNKRKVGILRSIQPPASPTQSTSAQRVHFETPSRTIHEDKVKRGIQSIMPPTECPVCQLILPTKGAFKNHLEIHEGQKPFVCPECYWGYETEIQLLEHHSRRHSKEAFFTCGGCTKKYKTSLGLHNHQILKKCNSPRAGPSGQ